MNITINEALSLKNNLATAISRAKYAMQGSQATKTFEIALDGTETDVTTTGHVEMMDAWNRLHTLENCWIELEEKILLFNATSGVSKMVRQVRVLGEDIEAFEHFLPVLVEVSRKAPPPPTGQEQKLKSVVVRPMYEKKTVKAIMKELRATQRVLQNAIFTANTSTIDISFNPEEILDED